MAKGQPVWVNNARTKTASDIQTTGECEALIRRLTRDLDEIYQKMRSGPDQKLSTALRYKNLALDHVKRRFQQLS